MTLEEYNELAELKKQYDIRREKSMKRMRLIGGIIITFLFLLWLFRQ